MALRALCWYRVQITYVSTSTREEIELVTAEVDYLTQAPPPLVELSATSTFVVLSLPDISSNLPGGIPSPCVRSCVEVAQGRDHLTGRTHGYPNSSVGLEYNRVCEPEEGLREVKVCDLLPGKWYHFRIRYYYGDHDGITTVSQPSSIVTSTQLSCGPPLAPRASLESTRLCCGTVIINLRLRWQSERPLEDRIATYVLQERELRDVVDSIRDNSISSEKDKVLDARCNARVTAKWSDWTTLRKVTVPRALTPITNRPCIKQQFRVAEVADGRLSPYSEPLTLSGALVSEIHTAQLNAKGASQSKADEIAQALMPKLLKEQHALGDPSDGVQLYKDAKRMQNSMDYPVSLESIKQCMRDESKIEESKRIERNSMSASDYSKFMPLDKLKILSP